jgi:hypothetical protein
MHEKHVSETTGIAINCPSETQLHGAIAYLLEVHNNPHTSSVNGAFDKKTFEEKSVIKVITSIYVIIAPKGSNYVHPLACGLHPF